MNEKISGVKSIRKTVKKLNVKCALCKKSGKKQESKICRVCKKFYHLVCISIADN